MTAVLDRPTVTATTPPGTRAQLWARGSLAAVSTVAVAAATLMVLVLIAWAADPRSSASAADASRLGLSLLPLACRVPLGVSGGTVAIPPLGLTMIAGFSLYRAGGALTSWWSGVDVIDLREAATRRRRGRDDQPIDQPAAPLQAIGEVTLAVAVPFALLVTILSAATGDRAVHPLIPLAPLAAFALAGLAAAAGAMRRGGCWRLLIERFPMPVRDGLTGGLLAVAVLLGAAALLFVGSLALHAGRLTQLAHPQGGGVVGSIVLGLISLLLLPNAVIAAVGYLCGAGVAVGGGSSVGLGSAHAAHVPGLPLLAAVPHEAAPFAVQLFVVLAIGSAGVAAALFPRRGGDSMLEALARAGVASAVAAVVAGMLAGYAGGPAGPGGLATVGASAWRTGLLVLVEVAAVALVTAVSRACWAAYVASRT